MVLIMTTTFDMVLKIVDKPVKKRVLFVSFIIFLILIFGMNFIEIIFSKINYDSFKCFFNTTNRER